MSRDAGARGETATASLAGANIIALAAMVAPPLAVFAPLGEAGLLALAAVLLVLLDPRGSLAACRRLAAPLALLVALALWGAASALWSIVPGHSLFEALRFLGISAAGAVVLGEAGALAPGGRARVDAAVVAGAALAFVLLQLELWDGQAIGRWLHHIPEGRFFFYAYDRGVVMLVLIAWPVMALAHRRFGFWGPGAVAILVLLTLAAFYSQAAVLAMVMGIAASVLAWRVPRFVATMMIVGAIASAFVLPSVLPDGETIARWQAAVPMRKSGPHRLAIWHFVAARMSERPVLGWGMDASRAIPGGEALVQDVVPALQLGPMAQILPLHPHNAALQWRLELGVPGTVIALAFLALALSRAAGAVRRVSGLGFAGAGLIVAMLSYGAWQAWWLSSLWLGASFIAATATAPPENRRRRGGAA
ncbi:MAG TPA: O-antigen ligase family protein [Stellaceae bacterium]|nr:O-antigen ligase family protein [Stellaceae bacterium]